MKETTLISQATAIPEPFPPKEIWILGGGRFGSLAARRLTKRFPDSDFLVIDHRGERLEEIRSSLGLAVMEREAATFLLEEPLPRGAWLIPAVPVHVAFLWISHRLGGGFIRVAVPDSVDAQVPNPFRTSETTLYASFATFTCPDHCNEPYGICTFTGKPHPGNLYERLQAIKIPPFDVVVVRSWQLAPGVGGYPAAYLQEKLNEARSKSSKLLIATSCRCHGVIDALSPAPS
jgi:voltage-gated potassium channel Kch